MAHPSEVNVHPTYGLSRSAANDGIFQPPPGYVEWGMAMAEEEQASLRSELYWVRTGNPTVGEYLHSVLGAPINLLTTDSTRSIFFNFQTAYPVKVNADHRINKQPRPGLRRCGIGWDVSSAGILRTVGA